MNNKLIGKFLQEKRKENNMTQADLAKKLNVTYQAVSRWETGESIPDIATLDHIATLYQISIDEILQRDIEKTEKELETNEPLQLIMFILVLVAHAFGFGLFGIFVHYDLLQVGLLAYFFFIVAGLFVQNISFVTNENKSKNDKIFYFLSYVPILISILYIALVSRQ